MKPRLLAIAFGQGSGQQILELYADKLTAPRQPGFAVNGIEMGFHRAFRRAAQTRNFGNAESLDGKGGDVSLGRGKVPFGKIPLHHLMQRP